MRSPTGPRAVRGSRALTRPLRGARKLLGLAAALLLSVSLAGFATAASAAAHAPATRRVCGAVPRPGYAACFSIVRTDVPGRQGLFAAGARPPGYGPDDLRSAYGLPSATAGAGQTVAIVDAYDDPHAEADLAVYRAQYGLPPCTTANGCFRKVAQNGSTSYPSPDPADSWELEESLDVDMVSAVCPKCHILLVEADNNSDANLGTAVNEAVALGAKYVSNSYGGSESRADLALDADFDHPGVAVTASAGDSGYGVSYPAASRYVTAVGGTTLTRDTKVARGWSETAWSGSGSGCSAYDPKPAWQKDKGCPRRTVADVSADADPNTGVAVYDTFTDSGWQLIGGTSVGSPIIASVYALAGSPGEDPSSYPYADPSALHDVTKGSNGSCGHSYLCTAGPGYDGPTGLGTPDGVAAFTIAGPHGEVTGEVTGPSGAGLPGAQVDVGAYRAVTDASGDYSLTVPAGHYDVTARDFGYLPSGPSGVQVGSGFTATESFALRAAARATLTGTVADGSGQGWPLYARVSVAGTSVYTNPATGRYSVTLPGHATYTVRVSPVYAGYQTAARSVVIGSGSTAADFRMPVDPALCDAPGYHFVGDGPAQTFSRDSAPPGWVVQNYGQPGWAFDNPAKLTNQTGGTGNFAVLPSAYYGKNKPSGTDDLNSPSFNLSQDRTPVLTFDQGIKDTNHETTASADLSTDGGRTWTVVWEYFYGRPRPDHTTTTIPLPKAAGQRNVKVQFQYYGPGAGWWEVDNVYVGDQSCAPAAGGLVEGRITDGNTGAGVDGATVISKSGPGVSAVTSATPGDPRRDGFYYLFSRRTGGQRLTAAHALYRPAAATVTVTARRVVTANLALPAGRLAVSPGTVSATVRLGTSVSRTVRFTDTGRAPVAVHLYQQPGTFTAPGQHLSPATGQGGSVPVERINGTFTPNLVAAGLAAPKGTAAGSAAAPRGARPGHAPWTAIASYPIPIMDNGVATDPATGDVYSVGGVELVDGVTSPVRAAYVYSPARGSWAALPDPRYARQAPAAAFIGGKLYLTGGAAASGGSLVKPLEIYDPATGRWSAGASIPHPYYGSSVTVADGKMYVIGGCGIEQSLCTSQSDVQIYDPASNSWRTGAPYPILVSFDSCGAIQGHVYCAGGITVPGPVSTARAYSYDLATNRWAAIAPLPESLWGSGYSAADGLLLVSGGVTDNFSTITNQGFAYDPSSGTWSALPNSPGNVVYRGGSGCGFYRVGGSTGGLTPEYAAEQLAGYGGCAGISVPWLSQSRTSFTVQPGQTVTVTVTMKAGQAPATRLGTYTASLAVRQDTPYAFGQAGLRMLVVPRR